MLPCFSVTTFATRSPMSVFFAPSLRRSVWHAGVRRVKLQVTLTRSSVYCYSTGRRKTKSEQVLPPAPAPAPATPEEESGAVYVVRKGDLVGVYQSLKDCQAQVSSVCDPPVSVFRGASLSEETVKHLSSCGLRNALYVINAAHLTENLFGKLVPCPFQQPDGHADPLASEMLPVGKAPLETKEFDKNDLSCVLKFDGASKGNPGRAGAGAILCSEDGSKVWKLYEGLGVATNNVAEYRAMILGLKYALEKGFKEIRVRGDSKLICMQMQGLWRARHQNIVKLCKEAKELRDQFSSFEISHIAREFNADADALANVAANLNEGETLERCC